MQKKFLYPLAVLVILLALIGPLVYQQQTANTGPREGGAAPTPAGVSLPAGRAAAAGVPDGAGNPQGTATPDRIEKTAGGKAGTGTISGGVKAAAPGGVPRPAPPAKEAGGQNDAGKGAALQAAVSKSSSSGEGACPAAGGCLVEIAIVGMKGQILYGPAPVTVDKDNKWGLTALGALDATGVQYSLSPVYGNLVQSIAGQANKGMRGWMYKVNGETPMVAASEKVVNPGDKIIWWYSESIDNPGPAWQDLKAVSP
ncbi:hypothetical protein MGLY_32890 [Neomoorella glycerini]|uniref:Transcobalamin-like C-terminal domain-containing protein n=1 Tax=Neomoorella glycerini TaxID=55779 RepID=A0A6I5ZVN8_9FIRM|nr:DUF4430 domain-containing protein [Moorella glycerini]QGP93866.1 hypothetical protein MGLY_32890 [Moorella glycerini]